ncbi:putative ABC transporter ATP-binding protein YbbL [Planctomycetes bacterium Pan216]|uniref:Putative ABC transporter ATP-binding protein YbbL n=1 Tax=Kolteria novifilia TaxID=2527975 RepID=A0A518B4W2_9BACT|nr:putative ABC transporter ATP-binding protein YbbL [Planctomycetes bacterium Pan216]
MRSDLEAAAIGVRVASRERWLLRDVDFSVSFGERVGLSGPSGGGKSTLLRALVLLDPLESGSIRWRGNIVDELAIPTFRSEVTYVHQRPAFLEGTVEENLRLPFQLRAQSGRKYDAELAVRWLERLGRPPELLTQRADRLSGGEGQLVSLVRVLQLRPSLLLLDEPTSALDPETSGRVEEVLVGWVKDRPDERACVWVSHDADQVERVSTRRLLFANGQFASPVGEGAST